MHGEYGGVLESEILDVLTAELEDQNLDVGPMARFSRSATSLVERRTDQGESVLISVFLLADDIVADSKDRGWIHFPTLSNGTTPISGAVWLVGGAVKTAYRVLEHISSAAEAFVHVPQANLGSKPALIAEWDNLSTAIRFYPLGLSHEEVWVTVSRETAPIAESELKAQLDKFYETVLRLPHLNRWAGAPKLWIDARKKQAVEEAEKWVQKRLKAWLETVFHNYKIREELDTTEGRADLMIGGWTQTPEGRFALRADWGLELKALRSVHSSGTKVYPSENKNAIQECVTQAIAYRAAERVDDTAACFYDLRLEDEGDEKTFAEVKIFAANENVRLWRWQLHGSAKEGRERRFGPDGSASASA